MAGKGRIVAALLAAVLAFAAWAAPAYADDGPAALADALAGLAEELSPSEPREPEIVFGQAKRSAEGAYIPFELSCPEAGSYPVLSEALAPYAGKAVRVRIPGMAEQRMDVGTVLENGVRMGRLQLRLPAATAAKGSIVVVGVDPASAPAQPAVCTLSAAPAQASRLAAASALSDAAAAAAQADEASSEHACNCCCASCSSAASEEAAAADVPADSFAPVQTSWNGVIPPRTPDVMGSEYAGRIGRDGRPLLPATSDPTSMAAPLAALASSLASFAGAAVARRRENR